MTAREESGARDGPRRHVVVHARLAVDIPVRALPGARLEEPVEHFGPADAERVFQILARSGSVPIEGDGEGANAG
jgi:hypothetical protein